MQLWVHIVSELQNDLNLRCPRSYRLKSNGCANKIVCFILMIWIEMITSCLVFVLRWCVFVFFLFVISTYNLQLPIIHVQLTNEQTSDQNNYTKCIKFVHDVLHCTNQQTPNFILSNLIFFINKTIFILNLISMWMWILQWKRFICWTFDVCWNGCK